MRAVRFMIFTILSSILLGCAGFNGIMANSQGTSDYDPHTGSQGLELRFIKDNPPTTIYRTASGDTFFPILIEIWNRGATDIDSANRGYIIMSGYDTQIIRNVVWWKPLHSPALSGKSAYNSVGGYRVIDMSCAGTSCNDPETTVVMDAGVSEYRPRIQATACYEYYTDASPAVCIDGNPYTAIEDKPCNAGQVSLKGSQGAPVAITSVEEIAMPGSVQFRIYVSNVGSGKVVDRSSIQRPSAGVSSGICPNGLGFEDLNKVSYSVSLEGATTTHCEPSSTEFRLVDGRGVIFCTFDLNTLETYLTPLQIHLEYGYMESIYQDVTIRNLAT